MSSSRRPVALVTGGTRRIGAAISRGLARRGYTVGITWQTSRAEAVSLAREIGGRAFGLDLARPGKIRECARRVERALGRVDLLVHNAAVFPRTPVETIAPEAWDRIFAVNLRGPFLLTRALLPLLRKAPGGGAVLFLGDAGAGRLWPAHLPYCLSKIALERQAAAWKTMLAPAIRVGIVTPGLALMPEGFPKREWDRLRKRGNVQGPDSLEKIVAAVLRFARPTVYTVPRFSSRREENRMKKWKCIVCAYVYDPAVGDPDNGVDPGTRFEDIPEDWVCPLCGAGKDEFEEIQE